VNKRFGCTVAFSLIFGEKAMPQKDSLREYLEAALDAIDEAHDTHIFAEGDEHPTDCHYCAIVRDGRAALAHLDSKY
jgi:hypothetical protein